MKQNKIQKPVLTCMVPKTKVSDKMKGFPYKLTYLHIPTHSSISENN
jgi:hypothetical protein